VNSQFVKKMVRLAMVDEDKRRFFVGHLRDNPSMRSSLRSRIASEEVIANGPEIINKTFREFSDLLPELKKINIRKEMGKTAKKEKKFSPETKALIKEFNEEFKKLGEKYEAIQEPLKQEIKEELKGAMDEKKRLAKDKNLNKDQKKKFLSKWKKKLEGPLMKKIDQTISDFQKEQKALVKKYADKDPDFRKASGHLSGGQKFWEFMNKPREGLFYTLPLWGFMAVLALKVITRIAVKALVVV